MQLFDIRTVRILFTISVFVAACALLYGLRHTLVVFLFAIFFAYLLEPVVSRVQDSPLARNSRVLAIAETYVVLTALVVALAFFFGPGLVKDTQSMVQSLPKQLDSVSSGNIVWQLDRNHSWSYETKRRIAELISSHRQQILNWMGQVAGGAAHFLANTLWVALVPILAAFFLADGRRLAQVAINAVDERDQRHLLRAIIDDLDRMLARFIFSQIVLVALSLVAYSSFLMLLKFPYALALGLAGGLMEFIPVMGPLVAAAAMVGVGLLTGFTPLWVLVVFLGVWRLCTDYIISPRIYGKGLKLHPFAAIAAVLMGGELGGILGVYLSIPIAAAVRVLWSCWQDYAATVKSADTSKVAEMSPVAPRRRAIR